MSRHSGLTVAERLIIHLSAFSHKRDAYIAPFEVTQDGIADGIGISRPHAAISARGLIDKGYVETRLSHITGYPWRRKAYFLTIRGEEESKLISERLKELGPIGAQICDPTPAKTAPRQRRSLHEELEELRRRVAVLESKGA